MISTVALESNQVASDPATTAVELAHRLAFRSGLGNSLFASPLEPVTLNAVRGLYTQARTGQVALIGTGIEFNKLKAAADPFFGDELEIALAGGNAKTSEVAAAPKPEQSKYFGGEERQALDLHTLDTPGVAPTLVVAYGSTAPSTPSSVLENMVIAHLIGTPSPSIKRVPGTGPLATAVSSVEGASASSFVASYSDASLLVVEVQAPGTKRLSQAGSEVAKALKALKTVSKDQLKAAVAKAKFEVASKSETSEGLVELVVPQVSTSVPDSASGSGRSNTELLDALFLDLLRQGCHPRGVVQDPRCHHPRVHLKDARHLPQVQAYRRVCRKAEPDELRRRARILSSSLSEIDLGWGCGLEGSKHPWERALPVVCRYQKLFASSFARSSQVYFFESIKEAVG